MLQRGTLRDMTSPTGHHDATFPSTRECRLCVMVDYVEWRPTGRSQRVVVEMEEISDDYSVKATRSVQDI